MRWSGMILFDKPEGWTSHDAAEAFRRILPPKVKVGHTGTLDPLATGLLILLVGPCTRLQARLQALDKTYRGRIRLGIETDSGDITGKVILRGEPPPLDRAALQAVLDGFRGELEMPAPAFSAVKYKGKALYTYARKGIAVPPRPRRCRVDRWQALSYEPPDLEHRLDCSSGTYVRSLAEVLGRKLGCGATVLTLRRDSIAGLKVDEALTLEKTRSLSLEDLKALLTASLPRLGRLVAE